MHHSIPVFFYFFPLLFAGMWILVTFIISRLGWAALAKNYRSDEPFNGKNIGLITAAINMASYKNALILKYNEQGIYLKTMFLFRLFHPPILIPWSEIKQTRAHQALFMRSRELIIGEPRVARILLREGIYDKMASDYPAHLTKTYNR